MFMGLMLSVGVPAAPFKINTRHTCHQVTMQCERTAVGVQRAREYEDAVTVLLHWVRGSWSLRT